MFPQLRLCLIQLLMFLPSLAYLATPSSGLACRILYVVVIALFCVIGESLLDAANLEDSNNTLKYLMYKVSS